MTLLQGNSQGCEAVLRGQGLAGTRGEQEPNHLVMILLQMPTLLYWDTKLLCQAFPQGPPDGSGTGIVWKNSN